MIVRWLKSRWFLVVSSLVLVATSLFWAILSARLQNNNADQLIDTYLFESWHTFTNASFPSAHSFLLKWPLFALSALFGNTTLAITVLTVVCALAPVAALVFLLTRIERRPAVLSLWFLALSSILLLVPAQPAPGTLLPVNFAMFTTRNVEYALFMVILALLLTNVKSWRSRSAVLAAVLAVILMASDGIFLPLFVGAIGLVAVFRFRLLKRAALWLGVVAAGYIGALTLTKLLDYYYITGFSSQGVSPYGFSGLSAIAQAVAYGLLGIATLFGANPAYAHLSLAGWPQAFISSLHSIAIVGYAINALLLAAFLGLTVYFVATFRRRLGRAPLLAMMTLGAALAAAGIYALSDHYYPVDSRYLAVWFFALILCAAVVLRSIKFSKKAIVIVAAVLAICLPFAAWGSWQQYTTSRDALQPRQAFAQQVASQIKKHDIQTLVGDYWDVAPIRQATHNQVTIVPLANCTTPLEALASKAWQEPIHGRVAYLLNGQPYGSGFPTCSPADIKSYLGEPDQEITIRTPGLADSYVYVYDFGMNHMIKANTVRAKTSIPMPTDCQDNRVLQVIAHEDDDLLFMNPDLQRAVDDQACIMTIYVTAGDAGSAESYALGRMAGAQAAYTYIYNGSNNWISRESSVLGRSVTVSTMEGQPRLQLVFINLPDGNMSGKGFSSRKNASLERLRDGEMQSIRSIEGKGSYTRKELTDSLAAIMQAYQPTQVRTQSYNPNIHDGDHSDHHVVGQFTADAFRSYNANAVLKSYAGYPVRKLPKNVSGTILAAKEGAFFAYAGHDGAACGSVITCYESTAYGAYLPRQYSRVIAENSYVAGPKALPKTELTRRVCEIGGTPHVINCPIKPLTSLAY